MNAAYKTQAQREAELWCGEAAMFLGELAEAGQLSLFSGVAIVTAANTRTLYIHTVAYLGFCEGRAPKARVLRRREEWGVRGVSPPTVEGQGVEPHPDFFLLLFC